MGFWLSLYSERCHFLKNVKRGLVKESIAPIKAAFLWAKTHKYDTKICHLHNVFINSVFSLLPQNKSDRSQQRRPSASTQLGTIPAVTIYQH